MSKGVSLLRERYDTTILLEWAMLKTVFKRWVFPSPYLPAIIIPLDFPVSQVSSKWPGISFIIPGRASEKYCPTARDGIPERRASITCRASKSNIIFTSQRCHVHQPRQGNTSVLSPTYQVLTCLQADGTGGVSKTRVGVGQLL